jgi:hypothetical protein
MKRRDVLKGAAVAAGAAVVGMPAMAKASGREEVLRDTYQNGRSSTWLRVLPNAEGKFALHFQQLIEGWERATGGHMRPVGAVTFEPLMEDGEPWLMHRDWDPTDKDKPAVLYTSMGNVFRERRWPVIDRATDLRKHAYWRQLKEVPWANQPDLRFEAWRQWSRRMRGMLHRVRVHFEAVTQDEWRRQLGPLAGEYGSLELEVLALRDLHREEKLTTRGYYKCLGERWHRMGQIEASWAG